MSTIAISLIVFGCVFGGALAGIYIRTVLPEHHLSADSKDVVKLGVGLVGTMAALVLGLLIASAKGSYDTQSAELTEMSSKVLVLDRLLAHYGPETKEARDLLHTSVVRILERMWSKDTGGASPGKPSMDAEVLFEKIQGLTPKDEAQRTMQAQAVSIVIGLGQERWLMYEQRTTSVSLPLLIVLIFWLTIIFISFGLFAPLNGTVVASLFVSSLAVSAAILLILEMYSPYRGLIQLSSAPLRVALASLGK
jgi:hypothetical protein